MTRLEVVKSIMEDLLDDDIVIASTGYISREVYKQKDRDLNFYMQGSMGNALGIGIGVAMNVLQRVFVISGDGSALMGLGSMVTAQSMDLNNLYHIIIDNGIHDSTGGQPTSSSYVDFQKLYKRTMVYKIDEDSCVPERIPLNPVEITYRFINAIKSLNN